MILIILAHEKQMSKNVPIWYYFYFSCHYCVFKALLVAEHVDDRGDRYCWRYEKGRATIRSQLQQWMWGEPTKTRRTSRIWQELSSTDGQHQHTTQYWGQAFFWATKGTSFKWDTSSTWDTNDVKDKQMRPALGAPGTWHLGYWPWIDNDNGKYKYVFVYWDKDRY